MQDSESDRTPTVAVIWNPSAGSTAASDHIRKLLMEKSGLEVIETGSRDDALQAVRRCGEEGFHRVIAAGGDGTANAVVTALAQLAADGLHVPELAVLPLGSGNDLARSLGMPLDPLSAVDVCLEGTAMPLDLLDVQLDGGGETRTAGNMVTAGNTGKYLNVLTDEQKRRWGPLCYLRGAVAVLESLEVYRAELHIDDAPPIAVDALNLFFANGRTSGGGMTVCSDAQLDDGKLDLVVISDGDGFDLAGLTVDYLTSDVRENPLVLHRRCRSVTVKCQSSIPVSTDGDAAEAREIKIEVRQKALRAVALRTTELPT